MYENIGGKIKGLAKATALLCAIGSVVGGIAMMAEDEDLIGWGLLVMFGGIMFSWISTWILYGFGELIENTNSIAFNCHELNYKIAKSKPSEIKNSNATVINNQSGAHKKAPDATGWECTCGRMNPPYQRSCVCGATKQSVQQKQQ